MTKKHEFTIDLDYGSIKGFIDSNNDKWLLGADVVEILSRLIQDLLESDDLPPSMLATYVRNKIKSELSL